MWTNHLACRKTRRDGGSKLARVNHKAALTPRRLPVPGLGTLLPETYGTASHCDLRFPDPHSLTPSFRTQDLILGRKSRSLVLMRGSRERERERVRVRILGREVPWSRRPTERQGREDWTAKPLAIPAEHDAKLCPLARTIENREGDAALLVQDDTPVQVAGGLPTELLHPDAGVCSLWQQLVGFCRSSPGLTNNVSFLFVFFFLSLRSTLRYRPPRSRVAVGTPILTSTRLCPSWQS